MGKTGCHTDEWAMENGVHQYTSYKCPKCKTENCWNCGGGDGDGEYTCRSCKNEFSREYDNVELG